TWARREINGQSFVERDRFDPGRLCLRRAARIVEQDSLVVAGSSQCLAELGLIRKLSGQLSGKDECFAIGHLGSLEFAEAPTHIADAKVALGSDGSALRIVAGYHGEALVMLDDLAEELLVFLRELRAAGHLILDDLIRHGPQGRHRLLARS